MQKDNDEREKNQIETPKLTINGAGVNYSAKTKSKRKLRKEKKRL